MSSVRFETTISAGERPQTYALDRAATGTKIARPILVRNAETFDPSVVIAKDDLAKDIRYLAYSTVCFNPGIRPEHGKP